VEAPKPILIDVPEVEAVIARMARIPPKSVSHDDKKVLRRLDEGLQEVLYCQDEAVKTVTHSIKRARAGLGREDKPIGSFLFAGPTGVGKTELAKKCAEIMGTDLVRLQCYEGLDLASAAYEWNYPRQMMAIRLAEAEGAGEGVAGRLYGEEYLVERPLLRALKAGDAGPPVLLIDEIDRADEPFEAFLLEVLSDFQLSIPEIGTIAAAAPPIVVITSNRTRDVHDALKRRCLYHWVEHPGFDREVDIVRLRVPACSEALARQVAAAVEKMRDLNLYKPPGVAETIDWATALGRLGVSQLDEDSVAATLGTVLKYREDNERVRKGGTQLLLEQALARS